MVRMFINGLGDPGLISGRVIPKTQKMILDTSLVNTYHYKVWIKDKWNNPRKGVALFLPLGVVAIEKEAFELFLTTVSQFIYIYMVCAQKEIERYIYIYIYIKREKVFISNLYR